MKVLNLYAGIGGNRKLWTDVEVTAVECDEQRAAVYADLFPDDTVIVGDAHQYLLDHYKEFEFIWSSPPCPTHSQPRMAGVKSGKWEPKYPNMQLYEEIIFLQHFFAGMYTVENVIPYYTPLVPAQKVQRHLFWANFHITDLKKNSSTSFMDSSIGSLKRDLQFDLDLSDMDTYKKRQTLRNCVHPLLGKHVLDCARGRQAQQVLIPATQAALF